jgi:hypothetical protein
MPPGKYGLTVRHIGYDWFRDSVGIRAGAVDSAVVGLRTHPICEPPIPVVPDTTPVKKGIPSLPSAPARP